MNERSESRSPGRSEGPGGGTASVAPPGLNLLERLLDEAEAQGGGDGTADPPTRAEPSSVPPAAPSSPPSVPSAAAAGLGGASGEASLTGGGLPGALLANPAVLSVLPVLAENLAPLMGAAVSGSGGGQNGAPGDSSGQGSGAVRPRFADRHTALLCAIKPYLSPARREAAETVIRLCRVWDALEKSGISLSGLLGSLGGAVSVREEGRKTDVQ